MWVCSISLISTPSHGAMQCWVCLELADHNAESSLRGCSSKVLFNTPKFAVHVCVDVALLFIPGVWSKESNFSL